MKTQVLINTQLYEKACKIVGPCGVELLLEKALDDKITENLPYTRIINGTKIRYTQYKKKRTELGLQEEETP